MRAWLAPIIVVALCLAGCASKSPDTAPMAPEPGPQPGPGADPRTDPGPDPGPDPDPPPDPDPGPQPGPDPDPADPIPEPRPGEAFVVIAVVDSGINPYHEAFRRPELTAHPSTYVAEYPEDAQAIELTFGTGSTAELAAADADAWSAVQVGGDKLYWIPGTNIIGAKSHTPGDRPILDDGGHGTGTASVAAGAYGSCPTCLLVIIEGLGQYHWALQQSWIDIVTNSYGPCAVVSCDARAPATPPLLFAPPPKASSEAGQVVVFSSGNGHLNAYDLPQLTYLHAYTGPDWVVTVGAVAPEDKNSIGGSGKPVDIASYGMNWPAADEDSSDGEIAFSGTSCAAPIAAGVFGQVLLEARRALGDTDGGHRAGVVARGEPVAGSPFLEDGVFTRAELYEVVTRSAAYPTALVPHWVTPWQLPATPASALYMGWGVVDADTAGDGVAWMLGGPEPAAKPVAEAWMPVHSEIRQSLWGPWNGGTGGRTVSSEAELADVFVDILRQAFPGAPEELLRRGL